MNDTHEKIYDLIYEDKSLIAVSKAHGVHVIPDRYGLEDKTLLSVLSADFGKVWPVHRLDAGTGGLIIFARDSESHKILCSQFEKRTVEKAYVAITKGVPLPQTLMLPIGKGSHGKFKINLKSGKEALTSFTVSETDGTNAIVIAKPFTGRTHQIRIHLKALKAPLYQDWLYNCPCNDKRLTLFAISASFQHPLNGTNCRFTAPISDFMQSISKLIGLSMKNMLSD